MAIQKDLFFVTFSVYWEHERISLTEDINRMVKKKVRKGSFICETIWADVEYNDLQI